MTKRKNLLIWAIALLFLILTACSAQTDLVSTTQTETVVTTGNETGTEIVANGATAVTTTLFVLEREWGFHYELSQTITYERIELIKPDNYELLLADLRARTGLRIKRCEVGNINFLRDTAEIKIYYDDPQKVSSDFAWLEAGLGRIKDAHA